MTIREQVQRFCEYQETAARQEEHLAEKIELNAEDADRIFEHMRSKVLKAEIIVREILEEVRQEQQSISISSLEGIGCDGDDDFPLSVSLLRVGRVFVTVSRQPRWEIDDGRLQITL